MYEYLCMFCGGAHGHICEKDRIELQVSWNAIYLDFETGSLTEPKLSCVSRPSLPPRFKDHKQVPLHLALHLNLAEQTRVLILA